MGRVKKGDGLKELEKAFTKDRGKILAVIFRITKDKGIVEDVLQNTYLKAWVAFPQFKGESALSTWICSIARNEALSFLKKQRRYAIHIDTIGTKAKNSPTYADDPYHVSRASNIEKALVNMPPGILKTVLERKMAGDSGQTIATSLGIRVCTVKSRYRRAKEYLLKHSKEI